MSAYMHIFLQCFVAVGWVTGTAFSRWTWVSRYQNVSIVDFIGAKDDGSGGDNWIDKMCKAPVQIITNNKPTPSCLQAGCPSCRPTRCQSTEWKTSS